MVKVRRSPSGSASVRLWFFPWRIFPMGVVFFLFFAIVSPRNILTLRGAGAPPAKVCGKSNAARSAKKQLILAEHSPQFVRRLHRHPDAVSKQRINRLQP